MAYNNTDTTDVLDIIWGMLPFAKTNINESKGITIRLYAKGATCSFAQYYVCAAYHQPDMLEVTKKSIDSDEPEVLYIADDSDSVDAFMALLPANYIFSELKFSLFKLDAMSGKVIKAIDIADINLNLRTLYK